MAACLHADMLANRRAVILDGVLLLRLHKILARVSPGEHTSITGVALKVDSGWRGRAWSVVALTDVLVGFRELGALRCELEGSVGWAGVGEDVDSQVHGAAAHGCAARSAVLRAWAGTRGQCVHHALGGASVGSLQDRAYGSAQVAVPFAFLSASLFFGLLFFIWLS